MAAATAAARAKDTAAVEAHAKNTADAVVDAADAAANADRNVAIGSFDQPFNGYWPCSQPRNSPTRSTGNGCKRPDECRRKTSCLAALDFSTARAESWLTAFGHNFPTPTNAAFRKSFANDSPWLGDWRREGVRQVNSDDAIVAVIGALDALHVPCLWHYFEEWWRSY